jgi:hypothetical protein
MLILQRYPLNRVKWQQLVVAKIGKSSKEALINSTNVMKGEAHGTQQPRHINLIGEGVSAAQRSNSLVQSINQRFPKICSDSGVFLFSSEFLTFLQCSSFYPTDMALFSMVIRCLLPYEFQ